MFYISAQARYCKRERERDIDGMERIKTNVLYLNLLTLSNNNH